MFLILFESLGIDLRKNWNPTFMYEQTKPEGEFSI